LESTIRVTQKLNIPEIIKDYGNRLKSFIRRRVRSIEDSEDILQEVFAQLAEADRMMKPIDQITAWLFTVTRNRITDLYRKKSSSPIQDLFSENDDENGLEEISELLFDSGNTPETEYLHAMVWKELLQALEELPHEQRLVFELTELQGISYKEISKETGEAVNTLISRKRYAVLHLRKRLQILYNELLIS